MKALFIGGTGTISSAVSHLAVERGWELFLLNRGNAKERTAMGAISLIGDIRDEPTIVNLLQGYHFDVVVDFVVSKPEDVERDYRLFSQITKQYILISTEAVYCRPSSYFCIKEDHPIPNKGNAYACSKAACEEIALRKYQENNFPVTIVRPAHTYDERNIPVDIVPGKISTWTVIDRIRRGLPILVAGDGNSLWSMIHCTDFAFAFLGLMGNANAIGECVHIASEEVLTWNSIYDRIGSALDCTVNKVHVSSDFLAACWPELMGPLVLDKASGVCFDISKLKRLVPGFQTTIRYDQGVRQCLQYILSHQEAQIIDENLNRFYEHVLNVQQQAITQFLSFKAHYESDT